MRLARAEPRQPVRGRRARRHPSRMAARDAPHRRLLRRRWGVHRPRCSPTSGGSGCSRPRSTARSLDGITGEVRRHGDRQARLARPGACRRLPLRPRRRHAAPPARHDGIRVDASAGGARRSRRSERSPRRRFTKLRMCVFPKSYLYNENEPEDFRLPGSIEEGFDLERFDIVHFRRLERRIAQLGELGIEADLILFHAYDRWGFADLGPAVDERVPPLCRAAPRRLRERVVVAGERVRPAVVQERAGLGADRGRSSARRTRSGTSTRSTTAVRSTTRPGHGSRTPACSGSTSIAPPRTPTTGASSGASPS